MRRACANRVRDAACVGRDESIVLRPMDPSIATPNFLALGVIWYIVFLFSTVCHEGAHALAAKLGGDNPRSKAARCR